MQTLLTAALLPAILLMYYIYRLDRIEKEPMRLVFKVIVFGAISTQAASVLEGIGNAVLGRAFPEDTLLYLALLYFVVVAVSEEVVKLLAMKIGLRNNVHELNYRFDGVVYGVAASLGFAGLENILYIMGFGYYVAPIRALTAIPLHCITGVFMGHYFGMAMYLENRGVYGEAKVYRVLTLLVPVLIHGFYDFCASMDSAFFSFIFFVYIVVLDVIAFVSVRHYAAQDAHM